MLGIDPVKAVQLQTEFSGDILLYPPDTVEYEEALTELTHEVCLMFQYSYSYRNLCSQQQILARPSNFSQLFVESVITSLPGLSNNSEFLFDAIWDSFLDITKHTWEKLLNRRTIEEYCNRNGIETFAISSQESNPVAAIRERLKKHNDDPNRDNSNSDDEDQSSDEDIKESELQTEFYWYHATTGPKAQHLLFTEMIDATFPHTTDFGTKDYLKFYLFPENNLDQAVQHAEYLRTKEWSSIRTGEHPRKVILVFKESGIDLQLNFSFWSFYQHCSNQEVI